MKPQAAFTSVAPASAQKQPDCVGDYAQTAIQKYVTHILRQEKGVLAHGDPEFLHQMRIGIRRLRATCKAFGFAVVLPVSDRKLKRLGSTLGQARDLDVLQAWLKRYARKATLKKAETKVLQRLYRDLKNSAKNMLPKRIGSCAAMGTSAYLSDLNNG